SNVGLMTSNDEDSKALFSSHIVSDDLHFTRNRVKLAILGEKGVGKSSLIRRFKWDVFVNDAPDQESQQVLTKRIMGNTNKIELIECDAESLLVDDLAEEKEKEHLRNIRDWVDLHGCLILYDTTEEGSFDKAIDYFKILSRALPPACELALVGTKCDLKESRKTSFHHADTVAESHGLSLFEVSAKTSINCVVCLEEILDRIVDRREPNVESYVTESVYPTDDHSQPAVDRGYLPSILCVDVSSFVSRWWKR
ncbi:hypothetical protein PMAYCL1PPCAC_33248, partial [Pristionchus mayeri]